MHPSRYFIPQNLTGQQIAAMRIAREAQHVVGGDLDYERWQRQHGQDGTVFSLHPSGNYRQPYHPPARGLVKVLLPPNKPYDLHRNHYPSRIHIYDPNSRLEDGQVTAIRHFAAEYAGVSLVGVANDAPVHDGGAKAFEQPMPTNFELRWPGYSPLRINTKTSDIYLLFLTKQLCTSVLVWLKELKEKKVRPTPGMEKWDVNNPQFDILNLSLWAVRMVERDNNTWRIELFAENYSS